MVYTRIRSLILISILILPITFSLYLPLPEAEGFLQNPDEPINWREHRAHVPGTNPGARISNSTTPPQFSMFCNGIQTTDTGTCYVFFVFRASLANGATLNIRHSYLSTNTPEYWIVIYDGAYDRLSSTDFPDQAGKLIKGNGMIQQLNYTIGGTQAVTTETYSLSYTASLTWVTLFFQIADGQPFDVGQWVFYNMTITKPGQTFFYTEFEGNYYCDYAEQSMLWCSANAWPDNRYNSAAYMELESPDSQMLTPDLSLTSDQTELFTGQTMTFRASLTSEGSPIINAGLTIQRSEDNSSFSTFNQGLTDSLGNWEISYAQDETGTWYFRSTYDGNDIYLNTTSSSLEIIFNQAPGGDGDDGPPGQPPPSEPPPEDEEPPDLWCLIFGCPEDDEDLPPIITTTTIDTTTTGTRTQTTVRPPIGDEGLTDIEDVFPIIRPIVEIIARGLLDIDPVEEPIPDFLIAIAWLLLLLLLIILILIALFGRKGKGARGR